MTDEPFASVWDQAWRRRAWSGVESDWDAIVLGGGITGAGVLLEAARRGLRVLLVESDDFAAGASSRSGKLVHGGMRYLKQARLGLTRDLLLERDRLLSELPGLVDPLEFVLPTYRSHRKDRLQFALSVRLYDLLRGRRKSWRRYTPEEVRARIPGVQPEALDGGYGYLDAVTDDARLVLRTLREADAAGGQAMNYVRADTVQREGGRVVGVALCDAETGESRTARARVVFNTTGFAADGLRTKHGQGRLRLIRGTHLVFPHAALPIAQAVSFRHPEDGHYIYFLPWEGATIVGTTSIDVRGNAQGGPSATAEEVDYLLAAIHAWLPGASLTAGDLVSTFAGIRPVMDTGAADPYRESRESVLWEEDGLVTVIAGKLTGFRATVRRALDRAFGPVEGRGLGASSSELGALDAGDAARTIRLRGRYGHDAHGVVSAAREGELEAICGTATSWAELRWAARSEAVRRLDDLLLRRTRLGLVLGEGVNELMPRIREICREELGWDDVRWEQELTSYRERWATEHSVPRSR